MTVSALAVRKLFQDSQAGLLRAI